MLQSQVTFEPVLASEVEKFLPKRGAFLVQKLTSRDGLLQAMDILADSCILSAPVYDKGNLLGFLGWLDIIRYLYLYHPTELSGWDYDTRREAKQFSDELKQKTVGHVLAFLRPGIVGVTNQERVAYIHQRDNAFDLMKVLVEQNSHRALVLNEKEQLVNMASQSDVVRFLYRESASGSVQDREWWNCTWTKLNELSGLREAVQIQSTESVMAAINAVYLSGGATGLSCLAVTDDNGKLAGNFSASDLRGLFSSEIPRLQSPIKDFLSKHSEASLTPVVVGRKATILDIVKKLVEQKIHHVFMTDRSNRPLHVISLTDVLRVVYKHFAEKWQLLPFRGQMKMETDIVQTPTSYEVYVNVPGALKGQIEVSLNHRCLWVNAVAANMDEMETGVVGFTVDSEKPGPTPPDQQPVYISRERPAESQTTSRAILLPHDVDWAAKEFTAKLLDHGVLRVSVPIVAFDSENGKGGRIAIGSRKEGENGRGQGRKEGENGHGHGEGVAKAMSE